MGVRKDSCQVVVLDAAPVFSTAGLPDKWVAARSVSAGSFPGVVACRRGAVKTALKRCERQQRERARLIDGPFVLSIGSWRSRCLQASCVLRLPLVPSWRVSSEGRLFCALRRRARRFREELRRRLRVGRKRVSLTTGYDAFRRWYRRFASSGLPEWKRTRQHHRWVGWPRSGSRAWLREAADSLAWPVLLQQAVRRRGCAVCRLRRAPEGAAALFSACSAKL